MTHQRTKDFVITLPNTDIKNTDETIEQVIDNLIEEILNYALIEADATAVLIDCSKSRIKISFSSEVKPELD